MKICSQCKQEKPLDQYDLKRGKPRANCKACVSKYTKQHYLLNKEYYLIKARVNVKASRRRLREFLLHYYQTHSCVDCGESDPVVLEFDHVKDKKYGVATLISRAVSVKKAMEEIFKCEVVCANCHKKRTAKKFQWYKYPAVAEQLRQQSVKL